MPYCCGCPSPGGHIPGNPFVGDGAINGAASADAACAGADWGKACMNCICAEANGIGE